MLYLRKYIRITWDVRDNSNKYSDRELNRPFMHDQHFSVNIKWYVALLKRDKVRDGQRNDQTLQSWLR